MRKNLPVKAVFRAIEADSTLGNGGDCAKNIAGKRNLSVADADNIQHKFFFRE